MPVYSSDGICISFEIPIKNFIKEHNNGFFKERKLSSVLLWIYLRTTSTNQKLRLQIQNINQTKAKNSIINIKYLNDGWNTINITNIFHLPRLHLNSDINKSFNVSLLLKCSNSKECSVGLSDNYLEGLKPYQQVFKPLLSLKFKQDEYNSFNSFINLDKQEPNDNKANFKAKGFSFFYN